MRVPPVLILRGGHPERYAVREPDDREVTEVDVSVADQELPCGIEHRGAAVATAAGLVEHQGAVRAGEAAE